MQRTDDEIAAAFGAIRPRLRIERFLPRMAEGNGGRVRLVRRRGPTDAEVKAFGEDLRRISEEADRRQRLRDLDDEVKAFGEDLRRISQEADRRRR